MRPQTPIAAVSPAAAHPALRRMVLRRRLGAPPRQRTDIGAADRLPGAFRERLALLGVRIIASPRDWRLSGRTISQDVGSLLCVTWPSGERRARLLSTSCRLSGVHDRDFREFPPLNRMGTLDARATNQAPSI